MLKKLILIILLFIFSATILSARTKPSIAVLDLNLINVREDAGKIIRNKIEYSLYKSGKFNILERNRLDILLKENQLSEKNRDSKEYAIEAGRLLPAEYVVIGSVTFREKYYIQITVVEVKSGTLIYSFNKDYDSEKMMYNESEAIKDGIEDKIYESAPAEETLYPVKNNFYLTVNSGYIPPVRKAEEFSEGGFIINSEFGIRNLFFDNFHAGLYAGYGHFYTDGAINYSSMIPLLVTSSYKIGNNRFKIAPGFGVGTAFITIDKDSGSESAFEPCALLFIKGDIFINTNFGIEISANYYTVYEPEGNIDFISYSAGIIVLF